MFKNIQNYLLLRHPLLWNIKLVPMLVATAIINVLFFIGGYVYGAVDFTEYYENYGYDTTIGFITFFNIILSLLLLIIWLVFYLRNNAYKFFYPKSNLSLYKEWLLTFVICLFNCAYSVSFLYGTETRQKSYYPEQEVLRRVDILSKASMFVANNYHLDADTVIKEQTFYREFFKFKGRQYPYSSLLNKDVISFTLQDHNKDSINRVTVQQWLYANKKDSVYNVMQQFFAIAAEHNLKSNIMPQQWLNNVYNYPDFTKYYVIGKNEYAPVFGYSLNGNNTYYEYKYEGGRRDIDRISNIKMIINGDTLIRPKYYVPLDQLEYAYGKLSDVYTNPPVNFPIVITLLYVSIGLSLLVFSFRVTSGRDWLIALVSFGIVAIITGVASALITNVFFRNVMLIDDEYFFLTIWVVIVLLLLSYFIYIAKKNASKRISAIIINHLLWLLTAVIPVIAAVVFDVSKEFNDQIPVDEGYVTIYNPVYLFLENYIMLIVALNLLFVFAYMYFFTVSIKKWKGIAEA